MRLPEPRGPYPVGVTTFSHPVERTVFEPNAKLPNDEPALVMEEVLYNVYYPADVSDEAGGKFSMGVPWVLRYVLKISELAKGSSSEPLNLLVLRKGLWQTHSQDSPNSQVRS